MMSVNFCRSTQPQEFLSSFMEPLIGDPLAAYKHGAGSMSCSVVTFPIPQEVVPEYSCAKLQPPDQERQWHHQLLHHSSGNTRHRAWPFCSILSEQLGHKGCEKYVDCPPLSISSSTTSPLARKALPTPCPSLNPA